MRIHASFCIVTIMSSIIAIGPLAARSCESLASLAMPDATITLAKSVTAGGFNQTIGSEQDQRQRQATPGTWFNGMTIVAAAEIPAFCRVVLRITPSKDSDIKSEIWMPISRWNGKFMAVGNGGWAGTLAYPSMGAALSRGYAVASTNTGHEGTNGDASFALNHPEKVVDFGYRAVHEMALKAKAVAAAFYGTNPTHSYFNGCSTGGKEGLKEAQRFPADFDGIVAGAPSNNWTRLLAHFVWVAQKVGKDEPSYIPPSKYSVIHNAVLQTCDRMDGIEDGVLENPLQCKFDPKVLECNGADGPACLTAAQVETARTIYGSSINPRTGEKIYPGLAQGSELGWGAQAGPQLNGIPYGYFRYVVFGDPKWDYRSLNFDTDITFAEELDHETINATDANLRSFFARGGKLLQYHGWADNQISPLNSINYYEAVLNALGGERTMRNSYRLFMIPGMAHCGSDSRIQGGGEGLNSFDSIGVLEQWVENKRAPDRIVASRIADGKPDRTRPVCPYPQVARYSGTGSTEIASSFVCSGAK
jgi:feruloyl esterase